MFLDSKAHGEPWDGRRVCRSCKAPIDPAEPVEELRFSTDTGHKLEELNGTYHERCARPILSVKRALDVLSNLRFG